MSVRLLAEGEEAMVRLGSRLSRALVPGAIVYLEGDLGMGKTTLSRGVVQGFGHSGAVKSPTYTLIETYSTTVAEISHLDLYRLEDSEELDFIGFRDLLETDSVLLIEWPERVESIARLATVQVGIEHRDSESRQLKVYSDLNLAN